jgi:hypothetical protein
MSKYLGLIVCAVLVLAGSCLGGQNPGAKVAVHLMAHSPKRSCADASSTIGGCEDIVHTLETGDVDCFPVFFNLTEFQGCEYALSWPGANTCTFTSCSYLVIGNIVNPGDGVSHTWIECQTGGIAIPGWAWIYEPNSARVCVVDHPVTGTIGILDCGEGLDEPSEEPFCAGIGGLAGDDPCGGGRGDDGGEDGGGPPPLRIARVIEVTDGSTFYMQPIWSPDGRKLAFTRSSFGGVYVRDSDGSGSIMEISSAAHSGFKPVWTSDSEAIVLRTRTGVVGQSITIADVETGEITTLVEQASHPGQPDRNANGDITVTLDGETKVLDRETGTLETPDEYYSEDRSRLLDVRLERDYRENRMWVVEEDGTTRTEFPHEVLLASLSPAKDRVLVRLPDGNWYVSRFDGSGMVNLGPGARWDWSPGGERLVYLGDIQDDGEDVTAADVFVVNADGSGGTQLTHTPDQVEDYPVWSPDGTRIAYSTVHTGKILVAVLEETD